ncbi:cbb3-type cytochrome c oxidase N-terminal domain-containing protein [Ascidiimonas aurantiaca]|uniref:cbb3-type cytochrome c oxidase N-terminal domain-containing protein n=1 Tax=Ascidiimonas aurantiaca TaxID=1685432 RepID=UPI0030EB86C5
MKTIASYLRILGFLLATFILMELTLDTGEQWAIEKYPVIWAVLGIVFLFISAIEVCIEAFKSVLFRSLSADAQERYLEADALRKDNQFVWIKRMYKKLAGGKAIEEEHEIILDHNYDGIKELDNSLPPWWVYGFYITIVFAVIYLARYHIFEGPDQTMEYEREVAAAEAAIEEYKKTAKDLVDVNTVVVLTDASDLAAGKNIFQVNCVACHKEDGGGGIGPNLTDEYWILGGGIKNVFRTISEGGRDGKGMVAWKQSLKPAEIAQVASYLLTFQGTTPAEPKDPEGEIWVDPDAPAETEPTSTEEELLEKVTDSVTVSMN